MTSRILATIATLCAGLTLAAVPAARAGETAHPLSTEWLSAPLLPGPGEAPTCRAGDPATRSAMAQTAEKIARIRAQLAAEAASSNGPEVVVLGNRGYNYGSGAMVDPTLIDFEARGDR